MISKNHPVVKAIEESPNLDDVNKLLALSSIDILSRTPKQHLIGWFDKDAQDVDEMFEWEDTELGSTFWSNVQDKVFEPDKRTC